jgi:general secretion pathway protein G
MNYELNQLFKEKIDLFIIHHSSFTIIKMINIKHHYQYGYTLLELVVVLLLFSLLAGITIPRLTTMYDSFKNAYERDEVLAHLDSLGYIAFQYAREFDLKTYPLKYPK